MELADLRTYWAELNRRLDALDAKLSELDALTSHADEHAEHAGAAAELATVARVETSNLRQDVKRLGTEVAPVMARVKDVAALATVIKSVPWKDGEDAHVFADNAARALSCFIRTGATSSMVKTEPDPWREVHPDAIEPSRNLCGCGHPLDPDHQTTLGDCVRSGCLCTAFRHVEQEGPVVEPSRTTAVEVTSDAALAVLGAIADLNWRSGAWPTAIVVMLHLGLNQCVDDVERLLQQMVEARLVVPVPAGWARSTEKSAYAFTFLGWHLLGEHRRQLHAQARKG